MLTVIIATFNGARTLPRVLAAYEGLTAPTGGWKLVVVDDGSTDDTRRVVQGHREILPVEYVVSTRRGKNAALNQALRHASGDLLVFSDDDVVPEPDWLVCLHECASAHGDYSIFGGSIVPCWEAKPPEWLLKRVPVGLTFALTDERLSEGPIGPEWVWGPNMAIRRRVFDAGLRFDEGIGPNGSRYAMGGETEFLVRAAAAGYTPWFCPAARVAHIIAAHQLERPWLMARAFKGGRGRYRFEGYTGRRRQGALSRMGLQWVSGAAAAYFWGALGSQARQFRARWRLEFAAGYLYERFCGSGTGEGDDGTLAQGRFQR